MSHDVGQDLWIACKRDLLFYINTFMATYDPRVPSEAKVLPFNTYPFQDEAFAKVLGVLGIRDVAAEKSRDMGLSWMFLAIIDWRWRFYRDESMMLVSRKEDLVDDRENEDALLPKLDFIERHLPPFLQVPDRSRRHLHLFHPGRGNTITGTATTGDIGRGGRRFLMLLDEYGSFGLSEGYEADAASRDVCNCRLINSTPKGINTAHHDLVVKSKEAGAVILPLRFHWPQHPEKRPGLYTSKAGRVQLLDTEYRHQENYPFVLDGKLRSPWYDVQCKRSASYAAIAQELDLDYIGAGDPFFVETILAEHERNFVYAPLSIGRLEHDRQTGQPKKFVEAPGGSLSLWLNLDTTGRPSTYGGFVVGADVSRGTGASDSCLSVVNSYTGEKVAEYASRTISVHRFAVLAVAVCRFFRGADGGPAYLKFEASGPGESFRAAAEETGFANLYTENGKTGMYMTGPRKLALMDGYAESLARGDYTNHSAEAIKECRAYVHLANGGVGHSKALASTQASGKGANHGDRVIADVVACSALKAGGKERDVPQIVDARSFGGRQVARKRNAREEKHWLRERRIA